MTSKNLSISTENPTHILRCKIALRLRFVICILIFSICTLLGLNNAFAQEFVAVNNPDKYPANVPGNYIPLESGQAVLIWRVQPSFASSGMRHVISASIVSRFELSGVSLGNYGYSYNDRESDISTVYSVIDPTTIYIRSDGNISVYLSQIQHFLMLQNLGTVQQRKLLIDTYSGGIVKPYDFSGYLQPWIILGLVIAILIPAWYLMRRFLRG